MPEKLLLNLDVGPFGAALRVALGAILVPVVHALLPGRVGAVRAALSLAVLLFAVKVLAAVGRRLVPSTPAVQARWDWRRRLARQHDSFQWRKLLWVGIGILASASLAPRAGWEWALGTSCVAAGLLGEVAWRRKGLPLAPPVRG